jgi:hypothetical protein
MIPTRVRLSREKGAKLPPGTKNCIRTASGLIGWANPFRVVRHGKNHWRVHSTPIQGNTMYNTQQEVILTRAAAGFATKAEAHSYAVESFRLLMKNPPDGIFHIDQLSKYKHLACGCALDAPCHVDVLIEKLQG